MHSSRRVVHKINRITVIDDELNAEIMGPSEQDEDVESVNSSNFQCGECDYTSIDKETLMKHVEAIHLFPKLLEMQKKSNQRGSTEDPTEELLIEEELAGVDAIDVTNGHIEERSCPTPIPDEIYICAQCNIGFESESEFNEHELNGHRDKVLQERIRSLERELDKEKTHHKLALNEIERIKASNNTLEEMKKSLEEQIEKLKNDLAGNDKEEIKVLKNVINEQDKLIKKNMDKHKLEINELKQQDMLSKESLRSAVKEREVLRENDRILLNTFDMMKKYMDQLKEHYNRNDTIGDETRNLKCNKCDYKANSYEVLKEHDQKTHVEQQDDLIEEILYCCQKCKFQKKSDNALSEHMKKKHEGKENKEKDTVTIDCEICNYKSETEVEMSQHVIALHNKMFKCDKCDVEATSRKSLKEHFDIEHTRNMFCVIIANMRLLLKAI